MSLFTCKYNSLKTLLIVTSHCLLCAVRVFCPTGERGGSKEPTSPKEQQTNRHGWFRSWFLLSVPWRGLHWSCCRFRELAKGQAAHSVTSHALEQGGKLQAQDTQHMTLCWYKAGTKTEECETGKRNKRRDRTKLWLLSRDKTDQSSSS